MRKLTLIAAGLMAGMLCGEFDSAAAAARAGVRLFDPQARTWFTLGPTRQSEARSPVPREIVSYSGPYGANTIIVDTGERRLYYVLGGGEAIKYGVGVGRDGFQWSGTHKITRKAEWPGWTPPPAMRKRQPNLPAHMAGGPNNPLGARALYIGSTLYRIHGSNEPWSIGQAVSSGCIRMANDDVIHLYDQVSIGTKIIVQR